MPRTLRLSHRTRVWLLFDRGPREVTAKPLTSRGFSDYFQSLGMKRSAVLLGRERVRIDGFAVRHRHYEIDVAGPCALGVETRGLRRVVGMAVVVADDVLAVGVSLALDADVVARIDLVPVSRTLDDDVARPLGFGRGARAARADQDSADLARVALSAMRLDRLHRGARDLHRPPYRPV